VRAARLAGERLEPRGHVCVFKQTIGSLIRLRWFTRNPNASILDWVPSDLAQIDLFVLCKAIPVTTGRR